MLGVERQGGPVAGVVVGAAGGEMGIYAGECELLGRDFGVEGRSSTVEVRDDPVRCGHAIAVLCGVYVDLSYYMRDFEARIEGRRLRGVVE